MDTVRGRVPDVDVRIPRRRVAFGRRDATAEGYERATAVAEAFGFDPVERSVGGRAVAHTGRTLSFAVTLPSSAPRSGIGARYETATRAVLDALRGLGAEVQAGEPDAAFCPGDHSVRVADDGKIAGIAQRVRTDSAVVAGCVVVSSVDADEIAAVLDPVYRALDVPFDPASVGSVSAAGGPDDPGRVGRALRDALAGASWPDADLRDHPEAAERRDNAPKSRGETTKPGDRQR